jgi:hypothetical protein
MKMTRTRKMRMKIRTGEVLVCIWMGKLMKLAGMGEMM